MGRFSSPYLGPNPTPMMKYVELQPSNQVNEIVHRFWMFQVEASEELHSPFLHETLPESHVSLVLIRQPYFVGVRLLGPHTHKFQQHIHPPSVYLGIRFLPWISFDPPFYDPVDLVNQTADVPESVSRHFGDLLEAPASISQELLESRVKRLLEVHQPKQDRLVKYICLELNEGRPIGEIVEELPHSIRVIQKRFKQVTGISMRSFVGNLRQRRLWEERIHQDASWTESILKYDFYDQAHFIRDFQKKMQRSHQDFSQYLASMEISLAAD